jgi:hypothetical protein
MNEQSGNYWATCSARCHFAKVVWWKRTGLRVQATATEGMPPLSCPFASHRPFATPLKRRGMRVPMVGHRFEPVNHLLGSGWILSIQGPPHNDTLDRLGHVQPTPPTQRGLQRENALAEHPTA